MWESAGLHWRKLSLRLTFLTINLVLPFYTPKKHYKTFRLSDVFRGYKEVTLGCDGLMYQYNKYLNRIPVPCFFSTVKFTPARFRSASLGASIICTTYERKFEFQLDLKII